MSKEQVKEALLSGLEPITMFCQNIYPTNGNPEPIAYRAKMVLNSTLLGTLTPKEFQVSADNSERGILLSDRALGYVCEAIEEKLAAGERFLWISLYCPLTMLTKTDLLKTLEGLFDGDKEKRQKICLELPARSLYEEPAVLRQALLDLKLLGVKSALIDYGSEYCPMMRLASFPFDYVILDPAVCTLLSREGGAKAVETLISFARNLRVEVIATNVQTETEQTAFYKADCLGNTTGEEPARLLPLIEFTVDTSVLDEKEEKQDGDDE